MTAVVTVIKRTSEIRVFFLCWHLFLALLKNRLTKSRTSKRCWGWNFKKVFSVAFESGHARAFPRGFLCQRGKPTTNVSTGTSSWQAVQGHFIMCQDNISFCIRTWGQSQKPARPQTKRNTQQSITERCINQFRVKQQARYVTAHCAVAICTEMDSNCHKQKPPEETWHPSQAGTQSKMQNLEHFCILVTGEG